MTHPSICIWVDIALKRDKSRRSAFFSLCNTENTVCKYQNRDIVSAEARPPKREERESEGRRENEENSGGVNSVSLPCSYA